LKTKISILSFSVVFAFARLRIESENFGVFGNLF